MKRQILSELQFRKNKRVADSLLQIVASMRPTRWNLRFVRLVFEYLTHVSTGYYSSHIIERFYVGLAKRYDIPLSVSYDNGSCLLVTHSISGTGGHARVMERWIENDPSRRYSIVLIGEDLNSVDQESRIVLAVKRSGGHILDVRDSDVIKRGIKLRQLASAFETIVLFTFPWNVEHVIAFGTKDFKRPIGFYNAPDHMFWIGTSVIDVCADIRIWGQNLTLNYRGIKQSMIVPVPMSDKCIPDITRQAARQRLSLPVDGKIIVTAARCIKYIPISDEEDFATLLEGVLSSDKEVRVICIGATVECFNDWIHTTEKWGARLELKEYVPHAQLLEYFKAADVVIDSYPFSGITTLEDAACCGTPIVSLSDRIDFVNGSCAYVSSREELTHKVLRILSDDGYASKLVRDVRTRMTETSGREAFVRSVEEFFSILEKSSHTVSPFRTMPSELTLCEKVRMNESAELPVKFSAILISKLGLIRPMFLAMFFCHLVLCLCDLLGKRHLRIVLYPIVVMTRPWRHRK